MTENDYRLRLLYNIASKKVTDLENQNKELKERLQLLNLNANIAVRDLNDLLAKAKSLLKRCYDNYIHLEPLRSEIEQFLKEIEKDLNR